MMLNVSFMILYIWDRLPSLRQLLRGETLIGVEKRFVFLFPEGEKMI